MTDKYTSVYDINTNDYLGEASAELAEASLEAEPTGAVLARWDPALDAWDYVPADEEARYARAGVPVRTVYVAT